MNSSANSLALSDSVALVIRLINRLETFLRLHGTMRTCCNPVALPLEQALAACRCKEIVAKSWKKVMYARRRFEWRRFRGKLVIHTCCLQFLSIARTTCVEQYKWWELLTMSQWRFLRNKDESFPADNESCFPRFISEMVTGNGFTKSSATFLRPRAFAASSLSLRTIRCFGEEEFVVGHQARCEVIYTSISPWQRQHLKLQETTSSSLCCTTNFQG